MSFFQLVRLKALLTPLLVAAMALAAGCGSDPKRDGRDDVEKLYADARDDLNSGSYDKAIKTLERIEGRAAGTLLAQQAMLDMAYAQWRTAERVQAIATLDRFIKLNPSSPALDYALYLKGIVNFNDNMGMLGTLARQNLSERDQQASRDAYQAFGQLVEQFPASKYSADAKLRMDYIVNSLAEHEVHVARYYFRRGAFLAAANRAQQVVRDYPQAPANEEALYLMAVSYERLGLTALRDDADRVLKKNFPKSRFVEGGERVSDRPWWKFW
ncbi:outer membrane protein assembly factor BamD [Aquincola sp. S2]|uniref:Outer membrane protein assembly factor BamD n=1 Tax=Pseudaquabacterium terrae TaxID=2732868 RepID=A0ABX2EJ14_9BURK|nr:outer membrane protein assembly factor BamD [Aquabacterium terrae]NRF68613.1 outer membrane protein assembly factor BamD [Aquabacterium terrae]